MARPSPVPSALCCLALWSCTTSENTVAGTPDRSGPIGPDNTPWVLPDAPDADPTPSLLLNEVQSDNDSTILDPAGGLADWVELLNVGDTTVALSQVSLSDGDENTWTGSADDGALAPGERTLLFGGDLPLPFSINAENDTLTLAVDDVVVDRLSLGELAGDTAWARFPDGGDWAMTARPTPGQTNGSAPPASLDPSDQLFSSTQVHTLWLDLDDSALASLGEEPYTEVQGSLAFRQVRFDAVGVRIKGVYGSLRSLDRKTAFKIDLNAFADHRLRGMESLTVNNMVQDPTYLAEWHAYTVFRAAGVPAPRVGWTRLVVNGEDWGLYALVESVDDTFLRRWYTQADGALYEGAYGVDFDIGDEENFEYDEGPDPSDRSDITAVAHVLDGPADADGMAALEALVDMDEFLSNMAAEALLLHWDGYTTSNNYRVYHDPETGRFQIIPWGTDQTFVDYWYDPWEAQGEIFTFCLQNADCEERYNTRLLEVADAFDALGLEGHVDAHLALLGAHIATDHRGEHSADSHADFVVDMRQTIRDWPAEVRAAVEARD